MLQLTELVLLFFTTFCHDPCLMCEGGFWMISDNKTEPTFLFISVRLDQSLLNPLSPFSRSSSFLSLFFRSSLSLGISLDDTFWLDSTVWKNKNSLSTVVQFTAVGMCALWGFYDHQHSSVLLLCSFSFSASRSSFRAICIHMSPAQAITQAASMMNRNNG